ncbi:CD209 antigen-like protein E isoform X2 [Neodiprion virginianus]|uniref:CD209 antigen-like protein E isoform X2 n=1 Tax=Neodiprion virginianus TaxID=2961670 RepID=UPI001EE72DF2|nr:CD209 antigen-like protein E isoform X2 [Neodiprion virginianus]
MPMKTGSTSKMTLPLKWLCLVTVLGVLCPTEAVLDQTLEARFTAQGYTMSMGNTVAYKVHNEPRTWHEAVQVCRGEEARLAIIDSYEKVRVIGGMKPFNAYVWVGVSRSDPQHPWITADEGASMNNVPWAPTKPSGPFNCLTVRGCNRGLSNEDCSQRKGFVCEKSPVNPSIRYD